MPLTIYPEKATPAAPEPQAVESYRVPVVFLSRLNLSRSSPNELITGQVKRLEQSNFADSPPRSHRPDRHSPVNHVSTDRRGDIPSTGSDRSAFGRLAFG